MVRNRRTPVAVAFVFVAVVFVGIVSARLWASYQQMALNNALIDAVENHALSQAAEILDAGASANAKSSLKTAELLKNLRDAAEYQMPPHFVSVSALRIAAREGDKEMCSLLLQKGADPNHRDMKGRTALQSAAFLGKTAALEALIARGADVNLVSDYGESPLADAVYGNTACVSLLLAHGAKVNHRQNNGRSAVSYVASRGELAMLKLLIASGADVNSADRNGRTPLWWAEREKHAEAAAVLRKAGARTLP